MDSQSLYSHAYRPKPLKWLLDWYLENYNDPVLGGAFGEWSTGKGKLSHIISGGEGGNDWVWNWIRSFLWLEALFQFPIFVLAIINLKKDNKKFYPYILAYGASTATTLLPSLAAVLSAPVGETSIRGVQITEGQRMNLLFSYVPFLLIPLGMAVDMCFRIAKIVGESEGEGVKGSGGKRVKGKSYAEAVKEE